jgi:membrane protease YdiL (CAAX protease family)
MKRFGSGWDNQWIRAIWLRSLFLRTDGTLRPGWKVLLFLNLNGLLQETGRLLLRQPGFLGMESWSFWLDLAISLLVSWLFLFLEGRPLASIGLGFGRRWGTHFLAGTAGGFLLMVAVSLLIRGLDGFHWVLAGGLASLASGFWLFLVVALHEELVFRGYAFQRLLEGTPEWLALGLASLYFAGAHWDNPGMVGTPRVVATLNIALVGVLLGLCYLKTRSLALPMGLHLGWNWTQGSFLGFGVSGLQPASLLAPIFHEQPLWLTGGAFGLEASLPCTLLSSLAIVGLVFWHPRETA